MEELLIGLTIAACPAGMAALAGGAWFMGRRAARRSVARWQPATRVPRFGRLDGAREGHQSFVIADLVGFTALTEAYGDEHAAEIAGRFRTGVHGLLETHHASEVKALGDGILLRVPSAAAAIGLGVRIADDVAGRDGVPLARVGVHTGSAVERDGDWFGSAVNTAARVVALAEAGQVLVTEAARTAAGDIPGIRLREAGERRLRNVSTPVVVYGAGSYRTDSDERRSAPPDGAPRERLALGGVA